MKKREKKRDEKSKEGRRKEKSHKTVLREEKTIRPTESGQRCKEKEQNRFLKIYRKKRKIKRRDKKQSRPRE